MLLKLPSGLRRTGIVAATLAAALIVSGCVGEATPTDSGGTAGEPLAGGDLNVALQVGPASLDPAFGNAPDLDRNTFNLFYEGLIRLRAGGEVEPVLAESFETSEDGQTLTFTLREGVTFSDGAPFNADAVVANLSRIIDPEVASPRANDLAAVNEVVALDDSTVEVRLSTPSPLTLAGLASEAGMMVSPLALEDPETLKTTPVGTGPFIFAGLINSQDISATRNPDYWGTDSQGNQLPYLDSVTMNIVPDINIKLTGLRTGQFQLIDSIPVRQVETVAADSEIEILEGRGVQKWMAFNTSRAPFDDLRVRQAVAAAIDRNAIGQTIAGDLAVVNATLCTPTQVCFDESLEPTSTNVEEARALLAEAGVEDLSLTLKVINREPDTTIAQLVQAQLLEAGITLEIQVLERESWIEQILEGDFDIATLQIGVPRLDPSLAFNGSFSENAPQNWSRVSNGDLADATARAASTYEESERRAAFSEAQQILLDNAYYVFFYWNADPAGIATSVQDIGADQAGGWILTETWLSQ